MLVQISSELDSYPNILPIMVVFVLYKSDACEQTPYSEGISVRINAWLILSHCGDLIPVSSGIEGLANLFIGIFPWI